MMMGVSVRSGDNSHALPALTFKPLLPSLDKFLLSV